jgi:putative transposase
MQKLYHPLLELIASAAENELAKIIQYLKEENRILRDKLPKRFSLTDQERQRLVDIGTPLGSAIKDVINIVHPRTFQRWVTKFSGKQLSKRKNTGRPKTSLEIQELVLKLARDTGWGAGRLHGELIKLGCAGVSLSTVKNILREHNLEPAPKRGPGSWHDFIHRHKETLYACDFFTKKIWTTSGLVEMYLLVFIHIGSRRIWVSRGTAHPNSEWVAQQARNMAVVFEEEGVSPTHLIHDRDTKFTKQFDGIFESDGLEIIKTPYRSPNLNAFCERVIQTIKNEALDYFVVFGEDHLNHIVSEFVSYYNTLRPHQGVENVPLAGTVPEEQSATVDPDEIVCKEWLGGVLKHYERKAA